MAAVLGLIGLLTGATGRCPSYVLFGINTLGERHDAAARISTVREREDAAVH